MDFTNEPKPTQSHFTDHLPDSASDHDFASAPLVRRKTDFVGYFLLLLGVAAVTALMAVIGGWPLVSLAVVVSGLGLIHFWTWGRSLSRKAAEEQAKEFRQRLNVDPATLSEIERPRHY